MDFDRHALRTEKRMERVDIYVPSLSLILEFDGSYWHESTEETDEEKARRLRTIVKHVARVREHPLKCLDPVHDVVVPFQAAPETAAAIVLKHLVKLDVISRAKAEDYLRVPSPRAVDRAEQILADLRRRACERKAAREQVGQPARPIDGNGQTPEPPLTLW
ncbi:hypothetical protein ACIO6T_44045 [Streptomyces sp. NPDC087532]|uniref:hypothetical protein n=1 Tax=Streptomyces sp. NPDC087532 TaxID=3365795 RepID=UPI00380E5234